jgi:hypothetical protein
VTASEVTASGSTDRQGAMHETTASAAQAAPAIAEATEFADAGRTQTLSSRVRQAVSRSGATRVAASPAEQLDAARSPQLRAYTGANAPGTQSESQSPERRRGAGVAVAGKASAEGPTRAAAAVGKATAAGAQAVAADGGSAEATDSAPLVHHPASAAPPAAPTSIAAVVAAARAELAALAAAAAARGPRRKGSRAQADSSLDRPARRRGAAADAAATQRQGGGRLLVDGLPAEWGCWMWGEGRQDGLAVDQQEQLEPWQHAAATTECPGVSTSLQGCLVQPPLDTQVVDRSRVWGARAPLAAPVATAPLPSDAVQDALDNDADALVAGVATVDEDAQSVEAAAVPWIAAREPGADMEAARVVAQRPVASQSASSKGKQGRSTDADGPAVSEPGQQHKRDSGTLVARAASGELPGETLPGGPQRVSDPAPAAAARTHVALRSLSLRSNTQGSFEGAQQTQSLPLAVSRGSSRPSHPRPPPATPPGIVLAASAFARSEQPVKLMVRPTGSSASPTKPLQPSAPSSQSVSPTRASSAVRASNATGAGSEAGRGSASSASALALAAPLSPSQRHGSLRCLLRTTPAAPGSGSAPVATIASSPERASASASALPSRAMAQAPPRDRLAADLAALSLDSSSGPFLTNMRSNKDVVRSVSDAPAPVAADCARRASQSPLLARPAHITLDARAAAGATGGAVADSASASGSSAGGRMRAPPTMSETKRSIAACAAALWGRAPKADDGLLDFRGFQVRGLYEVLMHIVPTERVHAYTGYGIEALRRQHRHWTPE